MIGAFTSIYSPSTISILLPAARISPISLPGVCTSPVMSAMYSGIVRSSHTCSTIKIRETAIIHHSSFFRFLYNFNISGVSIKSHIGINVSDYRTATMSGQLNNYKQTMKLFISFPACFLPHIPDFCHCSWQYTMPDPLSLPRDCNRRLHKA